MTTTRRTKKVKERTVHVTCETPAGYRWLRIHARGARVTEAGFVVTDESAWSESLSCAGGREIA